MLCLAGKVQTVVIAKGVYTSKHAVRSRIESQEFDPGLIDSEVGVTHLALNEETDGKWSKYSVYEALPKVMGGV